VFWAGLQCSDRPGLTSDVVVRRTDVGAEALRGLRIPGDGFQSIDERACSDAERHRDLQDIEVRAHLTAFQVPDVGALQAGCPSQTDLSPHGPAEVRQRLMGEPLSGITAQLARPSRPAGNHVPRSVDCPRQLEEERCR